MNPMEDTALEMTSPQDEMQTILHEAGSANPATMHREGGEPPLRVIEPPKGITGINWRELWRYRELLYFLTWGDVKVRYKQTVLGAAWAILQPFTQMVVFTIFFGRLAGIGQKTGERTLRCFAVPERIRRTLPVARRAVGWVSPPWLRPVSRQYGPPMASTSVRH